MQTLAVETFYVRPLEKAHLTRGRTFSGPDARAKADDYAADLCVDRIPCLICEGYPYGESVGTGRAALAARSAIPGVRQMDTAFSLNADAAQGNG